MWGKNKEFYRAGYLTEEPNLYRRTKGRHEGKKFQDYKHGRITTNEIGLTTREGYPAPRREKDGRRRCKMGSRDRGGKGKWRGGKGKREMKRTERRKKEEKGERKRGIGDAKRGASRMKGKGQEARERKKGDEKG